MTSLHYTIVHKFLKSDRTLSVLSILCVVLTENAFLYILNATSWSQPYKQHHPNHCLMAWTGLNTWKCITLTNVPMPKSKQNSDLFSVQRRGIEKIVNLREDKMRQKLGIHPITFYTGCKHRRNCMIFFPMLFSFTKYIQCLLA